MQDFAIVRSAAAAKCLVHPLRRTLLTAVRHPSSAAAVARRLGMPRQVVNYHVKALEKSGLVAHVHDVKVGNCMERVVQAVAKEYVIAPSVYARMRAEDVSQDRFSAPYAIASSLQTIDDLALGLEAAAAQNQKFPTFSLETEVHVESAAEQTRFAQEAAAALEAIARKYQRPKGKARTFRVKFQAYPKTATR